MAEQHFFVELNTWVIWISAAIVILASYSGLHMAGKATESMNRFGLRLFWLSAGSFVMGSGIWSMHMIGLLELRLRAGISFGLGFSFLSLLVGVAASGAAFTILFTGQARAWKLAAAGGLLGTGIVAVHYIGMKAIEKRIHLIYDSSYLLLSILLALFVSYWALFLFNRFQTSPFFNYWRLSGAVTMGLAISGVHYTAIMAAHLLVNIRLGLEGPPGRGGPPSRGYIELPLLIPIAVIMACILAVSWVVIFIDRKGLRRLAFNDSLTGLPNRHGLPLFFKNHFQKAKADGAVLFLDLDRFKTVNDTLGHDKGDQLLQEAAARIMSLLDRDQTMFRLGGDEFLVASLHTSEEKACRLAGQILEAIKAPFYIGGNSIYVTGSIGISLTAREGVEREKLMKAADSAMYVSKNLGKNRYTVFTDDLSRKEQRRMELENDLEAAVILQNQFYVAYQPKWNSDGKGLQGMEALLRWEHPKLGAVSPYEFIPIAEETGVIVPMTRWLMAEVGRQHREWMAAGFRPFPISVNMSGVLFVNGLVPRMVEECLRNSGMVPDMLELEITESVAMTDMAYTLEQLNRVKALGVAVSLDDFGTGYSSLWTLDEMPIDTLKIDQSFIRKYSLPSKQAMISSIMAIAHHLGLNVVAEGVETGEQVEFLRAHGCSVMQGYYFGKPMRSRDCTVWLEQLAESGPDK